MRPINIYFDCEFTWLRQDTTLISIWLISDCWKTFYAEFTDYDKSQCDEWINDNVIAKLRYNDEYIPDVYTDRFKGGSEKIKKELLKWFSQFEEVDIWSDCMAYDWVLFNGLMATYNGSYPELPKNINYIPFDICTLFKMKWIDPDISREQFAKEWCESWFEDEEKHNALFDAKIIRMCYNKLLDNNE